MLEPPASSSQTDQQTLSFLYAYILQLLDFATWTLDMPMSARRVFRPNSQEVSDMHVHHEKYVSHNYCCCWIVWL